MRYRRLSYRYAMVVRSGPPGPFDDLWQTDRLRLLLESRWRPDADTYETSGAIEVIVDLAGVDEEDFEVLLFEDGLVVEGRRHLAPPEAAATYHTVSIRQGPFRLELPLTTPVDTERVDARYDRGLLRITLPKRDTAP